MKAREKTTKKHIQMKRTILLLTVLYLFSGVKAQNIFPVKLNNCKFNIFRLDSGDINGSPEN